MHSLDQISPLSSSRSILASVAIIKIHRLPALVFYSVQFPSSTELGLTKHDHTA